MMKKGMSDGERGKDKDREKEKFSWPEIEQMTEVHWGFWKDDDDGGWIGSAEIYREI